MGNGYRPVDTAVMQNREAAKMKVFVVEDSAAVGERLVEMITAIEGATIVGVARDECSAVEGILYTGPDVAIVDIELREGNGIEVLAAVRKHLPGLTAIVLSNCSTPQYRKASADAGADYFFDKVQDLEKLMAILHELRDGHCGDMLH
jgi:DNA-binding NarL/FixJ family response regulator